MRQKPKLGRGKNMSIAKAALKFFFEEAAPERGENTFLDYGDLPDMHRIVDIAGANHCSFFTATQVTACLANSPIGINNLFQDSIAECGDTVEQIHSLHQKKEKNITKITLPNLPQNKNKSSFYSQIKQKTL